MQNNPAISIKIAGIACVLSLYREVRYIPGVRKVVTGVESLVTSVFFTNALRGSEHSRRRGSRRGTTIRIAQRNIAKSYQKFAIHM